MRIFSEVLGEEEGKRERALWAITGEIISVIHVGVCTWEKQPYSPIN